MSVDWVPGGDGAGTAQDIEDNSGGGGSTQLQHCPGIVENVVQLKWKDVETPFESYPYSLAGISQPLGDMGIGWAYVALQGAPFVGEHVRIHELQPGNDLFQLVSEYKALDAIAVIVANSAVDGTVFYNVKRKSEIPVVILTPEHGKKLLEVLRNATDAEVMCTIRPAAISRVPSRKTSRQKAISSGEKRHSVGAKLETKPTRRKQSESKLTEKPKSEVHVFPTIVGSGKLVSREHPHAQGTPAQDNKDKTVNPEQQPKLVENGTRSSRYHDLDTDTTSLTDPLRRVSHTLFPSGGQPRYPTEDADLFQEVMSLLQFFEFSTSASDSTNFLKRMKDKLNSELMSRDFPFYIVLANHVLQRKGAYGKVDSFVKCCTQTFQELKPDIIASVVDTFLKRETFHITCSQFDPETSEISGSVTYRVFKVLEDACLQLLEHVCTHKGVEVFQRMLWISVGLKVHCANATPSEVAEKAKQLWEIHLTKDSHLLELNANAIEQVKAGLSLGQKLQLPQEVTFSLENMSTLFVTNEELFIRPLHQLRSYIAAVQQFVAEEDQTEFTTRLLNFPRVMYKLFEFGKKRNEVLMSLTDHQTQLSAVEEGLELLDEVTKIGQDKGWTGHILTDECVRWLETLISLIDVRNVSAKQCFQRLMYRDSGLCQENRMHISNKITWLVERELSSLQVIHFSPLFEHLSDPILEKYLKNYNFSDFGLSLKEEHWKLLFLEFVKRRSNAQDHHMIFNFFQSSARQCYVDCGRPKEFVLDLLSLGVPDLFLQRSSDSERTSTTVAAQFRDFLVNFIFDRKLQLPLLETMESMILKSIVDDGHHFQNLVLSVLLQTLAPGLLKVHSKRDFARLDPLHQVVSCICHRPSFEYPPPRERFCWNIIGYICKHFPSSLHHYDPYQVLMENIGCIFESYCKHHNKQEPSELVSAFEQVDAIVYFKWVEKVHNELKAMKEQFDDSEMSLEGLSAYRKSRKLYEALAQSLSAHHLIIEEKHLIDKEDSVNLCTAELDRYLTFTSEDYPPKWCDLKTLLAQYEVLIPPKLLESMNTWVVFPQKHIMTAAVSSSRRKHKWKNAISVRRKCSERIIDEILNETKHFLEPLLVPINHLKILVFYTLHSSFLFNKHLDIQLYQVCNPHAASKEASAVHENLEFVIIEPISILTLKEALQRTERLLWEVIQGRATYGEVTAEEEIHLDDLDIEREFEVLKKSKSILCHLDETESQGLNKGSDTKLPEGLNGLKSMLELIKYACHIRVLKNILELFQLEQCIKDTSFMQIDEIAAQLEDVRCKKALTPLTANEQLGIIKGALCVKPEMSSDNFSFLGTILDSHDFFQFIFRKHFFGEKGQLAFRQLYELITQQLQHMDYEEYVLNHLLGAFKFISPFVTLKAQEKQNGTISMFKSLMEQVMELDRRSGPKQLETVNRNMHLIQLWFSQAEGDTLENIKEQFSCILQTGFYRFSLSSAVMTDIVHMELLLQFQTSKGATSEDLHTISVEWKTERISSFITQLGFLDRKEQEGESFGRNVKHFLRLNEIAYSLLEVMSTMRELGMDAPSSDLELSCTEIQAEQRLKDTKEMLTKWRGQLKELCDKYPTLVFFSVPKALLLYEFIHSDSPDTEKILEEISCLVLKDKIHDVKEAIECVMQSVPQVCATDKKEVIMPQPECSSLGVTGSFLQKVLTDGVFHLKRSVQVSQEHLEKLYSAPGYRQDQLIHLLLTIYAPAMPEPFSLFRCEPNTTEAELSLFLTRAVKYQSVYTIIGVDLLPFELQEVLIKLYMEVHYSLIDVSNPSAINFVETQPSSLRDIPWLHIQELQVPHSGSWSAATSKKCRQHLKDSNVSVQLVCGCAGDGKTYFIRNQQERYCTPASNCISVNESFTPLKAIKTLRLLELPPSDIAAPKDGPPIGVHVNITITPPSGSADTNEKVKQILFDRLGWFFFDLLLLGYVEDLKTGLSFRLHGHRSWNIYIEVPSNDLKSPKEDLELFTSAVPVLGYVGGPVQISEANEYNTDTPDVLLVCQYLNAYKTNQMDKRSSPAGRWKFPKKATPVELSREKELQTTKRLELLREYMPDHVKKSKISQKLFIQYMNRRCNFMKNTPRLLSKPVIHMKGKSSQRQAEDTSKLGSTLMKMMLEEVNAFTNPKARESWSKSLKHHLIYEVTEDGGGSIGYICSTENLPTEDHKLKMRMVGVEVPEDNYELISQTYMEKCLSRAMNIPVEKCHQLISESNYVLTLDYTLKMLNIHERRECGVPVIIEGETGVGKTALVEMLSKLWNHSLAAQLQKYKDNLLDFITRRLNEHKTKDVEAYTKCIKVVEEISKAGTVEEKNITEICQLPIDTSENPTMFSSLLMEYVDKKTPEAACKHLVAILISQPWRMFYKLPVHSALTHKDMQEFFKEVSETAEALGVAHSKFPSDRAPVVVVFLDEINTSSCGGLLKEIITDQSLDGKPIPSGVFVIGACNPHRGDSLGHLDQSCAMWTRGSYSVSPLHATLFYLKWDYGSLEEKEEADYVTTKMGMIDHGLAQIPKASLVNLIVVSQRKLRDAAYHHYLSNGVDGKEAAVCSKSCVSQRDIQRVFTFYTWLKKVYYTISPHGVHPDEHYSQRALLVALGIVYYLRLNSLYREEYRKEIEETIKGIHTGHEISFAEAFEEELNWYVDNVDLPDGIAKTQALKENLFATIACVCTCTPLIVVGMPGSSKTLSFHLAVNNLKGLDSTKAIFKKTDVFCSLDPYFYQCSSRTTASEINSVFSKATERQKTHKDFHLPIKCVVFLDEAGLPEESQQSLKALHYHLDQPMVSFVAISNHVLDAAKTNRAVSLVRPETSVDQLKTLTIGCLKCPGSSLAFSQKDIDTIVQFCPAYHNLMTNPQTFMNGSCMQSTHFFGLRDFIHFIHYFCRNRGEKPLPLLALQGLERNFNGIKEFHILCEGFLKTIFNQSKERPADFLHLRGRDILTVLQESLEDHAHIGNPQNAVRYKLIIDPSEDDSLIRYLFKYRVLQRQQTLTYTCSDLFGEIEKVNTIAAICQSVNQGHTVILSQTEEIHESFYDLFNLRFRWIDDPNGSTRYYANVAVGAHLKPCQVHQDFQCIVLLKESEISSTPLPFLNRFEKYHITHNNVLAAALKRLPCGFRKVIEEVIEKVYEFVITVEGASSFFGFREETIPSLLLSFLPCLMDLQCKVFTEHVFHDEGGKSTPKEFLLKRVIDGLIEAGFEIIPFSESEAKFDLECLFGIVETNMAFKNLMRVMSHKVAASAVCEAFSALKDKADEGPLDLSTPACLVISLLHQWTVRNLCKHLMQLMTPEALITLRRKIPSSYIANFLVHQEHFSLRKLIMRYYDALGNNRSKSQSGCPTKLLIYSRSSPLIHELHSAYIQQAEKHNISLLQDLLVSNVETLAMLKLSSVHSHRRLIESLRVFYTASDKCILLLVASMQEFSTKAINHLRVMIEETENQAYPSNKLVVLLLHFPSSMFPHGCYPSLFLDGWDHYYLDAISHSSAHGLIDTEKWLLKCCSPNLSFMHLEQSTNLERSLLTVLHHFLPEAVRVLASRLVLQSSCGPFNKTVNISQRRGMLKSLLFDKGIGHILCDRYLSYLTPSVLMEYLQTAAKTAQRRESTANLTHSIEMALKSSFLAFSAHMIATLDQDHNLNLLFDTTCTQEVHEMFKRILDKIPLPDFVHLGLPPATGNTSGNGTYNYRFPFYRLISRAVEGVFKASIQEINQKGDLVGEHTVGEFVQVSEPVLKSAVECNLRQKLQGETGEYLAIILSSSTSEDLWQRYFMDLTQERLCLQSINKGLMPQMLKEIFQKITSATANPEETCAVTPADEVYFTWNGYQIISLHLAFHTHSQYFARIVPVLKQFDDLQILADYLSFPPISTSLESILTNPTELCVYTIDLLFSFVHCANSTEDVSSENFLWYWFYQKIMSMGDVKESIYKNLSGEGVAKFNVLHTIYFILHCDVRNHTLKKKGKAVYLTLCNRFFDVTENAMQKPSIQLKDPKKCPHLADVARVIFYAFETDPDEHTNIFVTHILEGLFAHFFCEYWKYDQSDVKWFLQLSNKTFHWNARVSMSTSPVVEKESSPEHRSIHSLSNGVLKFYLKKVLTEVEGNSSPTTGLGLFHHKHRSEVGRALLAHPGGAYIPIFYQKCRALKLCNTKLETSTTKQQPLAHLYFLVTLETLKEKERGVIKLLDVNSMFEKLQQCRKQKSEVLLLHLEQQAVVQMLISESATGLMRSQYHEVLRMLEYVNKVLDDVSMGGGETGGHGLVLAMHLFEQCQSLKEFQEHIDRHSKRIRTLQPYRCEKLPASNFHLFQFLDDDQRTELGRFYHAVKRSMRALHQKSNSSNVEMLYSLAEKWPNDSFTYTLMDGKQVSIDKTGCFRMMIWLCAYYEFFEKEEKSVTLADVLQRMPSLIIDETYYPLFQYILSPESLLLTQRHRSEPFPDDIFYDGDFSIQQGDYLTVNLRRALVNLVAVVLGSPYESTHLWYHMFRPADLCNTYMTGFMYDCKVNSDEGVLYSDGVQLTDHGLYGKSAYQKHTRDRALQIPSLYILLWANYAAFFMACITCKDAVRSINKLLPSDESICFKTMKSLWQTMRKNCKLVDEEMAFLFRTAMLNVLQLSNLQAPHPVPGIFKSMEELVQYERFWHGKVYEPARRILQKQFASTLKLTEKTLVTLEHIRHMELCYPKFPTCEIPQYILSSEIDLQSSAPLLHNFLMQYQQLQIGGVLLSNLIKFYQWLHRELAYRLTAKTAKKLTIKHLKKQLHSHSEDKAKEFDSLYSGVKGPYNQYVELSGEFRNAGTSKSLKIEDKLTVLPLLSVNANTDSDGDLLYRMIQSIIDSHNCLIRLAGSLSKSTHPAMRSYTQSPLRIHPLEITPSVCIVRSGSMSQKDELLQTLIRRRCQDSMYPPESFHLESNLLPPWMRTMFHWHELEEDIVTMYFEGKPVIENPSLLRVPFSFKDQTISRVSNDETSAMYRSLPNEFMFPLDEVQLKTLQYEYHSITLETLDEVVSGLTTALNNLYWVFHNDDRPDDLSSHTFKEFMCECYQSQSKGATLTEIGIKSLSATQVHCIEDIQLCSLYSLLQFFVHWKKDGVPDFHKLPFAVKTHMLKEDVDALLAIRSSECYREHPAELFRDLQVLEGYLTHLEPNMQELLADVKRPIVRCLPREISLLKHNLIPESIHVHHYVSFRLAIRCLISQLQKKPLQQLDECDSDVEKWNELIQEPWAKRLPFVMRAEEDVRYSFPPQSFGFHFAPIPDPFYIPDSEHESDSASTTTYFPDEFPSDLTSASFIVGAPAHDDHDSQTAAPSSLLPTSTMTESSGTVVNLLQSVNLVQYTTKFMDEGVTEDDIDVIDDEYLKSIAIENPLHRLKIVSQAHSMTRSQSVRSVNEVMDFLDGHGMNKYNTLFKDNQINGNMLLQASDEVLQAIGIEKALDRVKIRLNFRRKVEGLSDQAKKYPVETVIAILQSLKLIQYCDIVEQNKIDGEILKEASDELWKDLGIRPIHLKKIIKELN